MVTLALPTTEDKMFLAVSLKGCCRSSKPLLLVTLMLMKPERGVSSTAAYVSENEAFEQSRTE
jgi:hypothetical protein